MAQNEALIAWLSRTGWSRAELARQVCARAHAAGEKEDKEDAAGDESRERKPLVAVDEGAVRC